MVPTLTPITLSCHLPRLDHPIIVTDMTSQRYEPVSSPCTYPLRTVSDRQVAAVDEDDTPRSQVHPSSPPPSFTSRTTSRRSSTQTTHTEIEAEQSLADAFDGPSDDESDDERDSRPLVSRAPARTRSGTATTMTADSTIPAQGSQSSNERRDTSEARVNVGGGSGATRDGVFANISAKPTRNDEVDEKPPVSAKERHEEDKR